jgi:hypothetical protein
VETSRRLRHPHHPTSPLSRRCRLTIVVCLALIHLVGVLVVCSSESARVGGRVRLLMADQSARLLMVTDNPPMDFRCPCMILAVLDFGVLLQVYGRAAHQRYQQQDGTERKARCCFVLATWDTAVTICARPWLLRSLLEWKSIWSAPGFSAASHVAWGDVVQVYSGDSILVSAGLHVDGNGYQCCLTGGAVYDYLWWAV